MTGWIVAAVLFAALCWTSWRWYRAECGWADFVLDTMREWPKEVRYEVVERDEAGS